MSNLRHLDYAETLAPLLLPSRADVLRALAAVADEDGTMVLSLHQLETRTGWSYPTVKAALADLRARGILHREKRRTATYGDMASVYRFAALAAGKTRPGTALARVVNM